MTLSTWLMQTDAFAAALREATPTQNLDQIFQGDPTKIEQQLKIYRHNSQAYTAQALVDTYPVTQKILGASRFQEIALDLWHNQPSQSGDLHDYGARLSEYCRYHTHTASIDFLPDLITLEWYVHCAYFAENPMPFDLATWHQGLQNPAETYLTFNPSYQCIQSSHPIVDLWYSHQPEQFEQHIFETIDLSCAQTAMIIRDCHYTIHIKSLSAADVIFLQHASTQSLLYALEETLSNDPNWPIVNKLNDFFQLDLFATLTI